MKENGTEIQIIFENDIQKTDVENVPYFFDRFYMADTSRNKGGTGLGLTIAKCLAEEMNGKLIATLGENKDQSVPLLRFTLYLKRTSNNEARP